MKVNSYGHSYDVSIKASSYAVDGTLALMLIDNEDFSPFAVLTVNLQDDLVFGNYAYVDTNNCPWAEEFIKENKLGVPTGLVGFGGYCEYPLYKFDMDKVTSNV